MATLNELIEWRKQWKELSAAQTTLLEVKQPLVYIVLCDNSFPVETSALTSMVADRMARIEAVFSTHSLKVDE